MEQVSRRAIFVLNEWLTFLAALVGIASGIGAGVGMYLLLDDTAHVWRIVLAAFVGVGSGLVAATPFFVAVAVVALLREIGDANASARHSGPPAAS